jgi:DNA-binding transcriptional LysR family regulator
VCLTGVPPSDATVRVRSLGVARPVLAAHPDYLARRGTPQGPDDLADHDCLRFVGPTPQTRWTLAHTDGRLVDVPVGGRLACNDSRTLLRALSAGLGIGPMPTSSITGVAPEPLVVVLPGWSLGDVRMFLALAPGRGRLQRVRHVADALAELTREALLGLGP